MKNRNRPQPEIRRLLRVLHHRNQLAPADLAVLQDRVGRQEARRVDLLVDQGAWALALWDQEDRSK